MRPYFVCIAILSSHNSVAGYPREDTKERAKEINIRVAFERMEKSHNPKPIATKEKII